MKHTRILTRLAAVLIAFLVSPVSSALESYSGNFVAGVDIGYAARTGTLNSSYYTIPSGPVVAITNPKISDSGTTYGALAGYQVWLDSWLVGLEGHIDWGRYEHAKFYQVPGFLSNVASYYQGPRVGATLRAGLKVPPFFVPYIKGGMEYSKHHLQIANQQTAGAGSLYDNYNYSRGLWTWLVGVGLEVPFLSDKTSLRLEYVFKPGHRLSFSENGGFAGHHSIKTHTHMGKLAWTWNFI